MDFIETKKELPKSNLISMTNSKYYLVLVDGYGSDLAMFLKDEDGNEAWYNSYISKIIKDVTHWAEIKL